MVQNTKYRLVLKETVSPKEVNAAAWDHRWLLDEVVKRGPDHPYEKIWTTSDEMTAVHYIEDFEIEVNYLFIEGPEADRLRDDALSSLAIYAPEEIKTLARNARTAADHIRAVYFAAIALAAPVDPELIEIIRQAASHEATAVRHSAIVAAGYAAWSGARDMLERLASTDQDKGVRHDARLMIEALAATSSGSVLAASGQGRS